MAKEEPVTLETVAPETLRGFFLNVVEPKKFKSKSGKDDDKEGTYSAQFLVEIGSAFDKRLIAALNAAAVKEFGPDRKLNTLQLTVYSGDKVADAAKAKGKDQEFCRGKRVFKASSNFPPSLAYLDGKLPKDLTDDPAKAKRVFYAGVEVGVGVTLKAYRDISGKDGIKIYLNRLISLNKGEKLAGSKSAAEVFAGYVGIVSDEDPTSGYRTPDDDEIPF